MWVNLMKTSIMRRVTLGAAVVGLALVTGVGSAGAVSQETIATAEGTSTVTFGVTTTQRDSGTYLSIRQIGSGRYSFVSTVGACDTNSDSQTFTGTATLVRSDGARLTGTVSGNEECYDKADLPVRFSLNLTTGTREFLSARIDFIGMLKGMTITPGGEQGTEKLSTGGPLFTTERVGWWSLSASGNVYTFGGAAYYGGTSDDTLLTMRLEPTPKGDGYWIVNELGVVSAFGGAHWFGNADRRTWAGATIERVVSIASTASGDGYWLFTSKGRVVPFGDARQLGEFYPGGLAAPIIAAVATPTHTGYYLLGGDGGVFAYGDAKFRGSTGAMHLNAPIVGMAVSNASDGYWLVASDGGVFSFGAHFSGSLGGHVLGSPIVAASPYGTGYVLMDDNGDVFKFSDQPFFGFAASNALTPFPMVGITAFG